MIRRPGLWLLGACLPCFAMAADTPPTGYPKPVFQEDGSADVPAFTLPPSSLMSEEARQQMQMRAKMPPMKALQEPDIQKSREDLETKMTPMVGLMLQRHPVNMVEETIAGVPVRTFTPKDRQPASDQILINVHGGAFNTCWESCSILESAPIADVGNYKVVSVNYRMAPEARHPAGVEDLTRVYRELLKTYPAHKIGIYGCSAGGSLTAQAAAWLPAQGLPQAGAIGIFGAGAIRFESGDSAYVAAYIDGSFPPPAPEGAPKLDMTRGYFAGADLNGPILAAAKHPPVLKQFPATLLITGTRAMDMSPAIYTNSQLLKEGKDSTLIVAEGMGHCYLYNASLPESQDAYQVSVNFFREHLK